MNIKLVDLDRQYIKYKNDIDKRIAEVIAKKDFIGGASVKELEGELAEYVGVKYAIGCNSGTDALMLPLLALGVNPGDEIITTAFTFIATAEVIALLKAKPVFVDINEKTYNINPESIEKAITKKTKGIIGVDLFGQCADFDAINNIAKKNNLFVIEDAAQSFGAQYKGKKACSLAQFGSTSFFPAKALGCYGDGGMVFTNNDDLSELMRSLRSHGSGKEKYDNVRIGMNSRLDTIQAAVLLAKLKYLDSEIAKRKEIGAYYSNKLKNKFIVPFVDKNSDHIFCNYCIRCDNRDKEIAKLKNNKIPFNIYYPKPLHLQTAFLNLGYKPGDLPVSEKIAEDILALPMHPFLIEEELNYITETLLS